MSTPYASHPPPPISRRRRLGFVILALLLAVAGIELAARVLLAAASGGYPSTEARAHERAEAGRDPTEAAALAAPAAADEDPVRGRGVVVHPFFGYVRDPAAPRLHWSVGPDGFHFDDRPAPAHDPAAAPYRVAVLGGSFANQLAFAGETPLIGRISNAVGRPAGGVEIRCLAMGGYKQPQQLHILADKLAHGERFDLVLNVDGFNEVVLPFDNIAAGLAPSYPSNWQRLVGGLPDIDSQLAAGEIVFLRAERRRRAGLCAGWRARSAVCHLLWRGLDAPLADRLAALEHGLREAAGERRRFEVFGPEPPPLDHGQSIDAAVALWQHASLELDALSRLYGIRYVHVLQPNQYLPGAKTLTAAERAAAFDEAAAHKPLVEAAYPKLRAAGVELEAKGVRFFDMSMAFAETAEPVFADRCCHLSRRGYLLFGAMLGDRLAATEGEATTRADHSW